MLTLRQPTRESTVASSYSTAVTTATSRQPYRQTAQKVRVKLCWFFFARFLAAPTPAVIIPLCHTL